ncbi:MAG: hypothetical protein ACXWG8_00510 [Usitatibacter sp.]
MTKQQQRRIDTLREALLEAQYGCTAQSYEVKRFEVKTVADSPLVFVSTETGLKNDEGTMAALLARNRTLTMIGPRGALKALGTGTSAKSIRCARDAARKYSR